MPTLRRSKTEETPSIVLKRTVEATIYPSHLPIVKDFIVQLIAELPVAVVDAIKKVAEMDDVL